VAEAARTVGVPVNVTDRAELSSFIVPAIVERDPVVIGISTGGAAPVLARLLRARLESLIPAGYGRLAALAGAFRDRVKARFKPQERRRFWERVLQGPIAELVFSGRDAEARKALQATLDDQRLAGPGRSLTGGEVSLVGAGPGDPDLLTFRALRLMQQADVVVYDRLVSQPILELVRLEAERIYVGKERDNHALPQGEINALMVRLAREGKRVVRLKGGDPFIFGRGGEEIDALLEHGIAFEVVPGITAAAGAASYAGIPLTHRDYAQSCVFVTGHLKNGSAQLDWQALARPHQTVAVYMGVGALAQICQGLIAHGMPESMPAAVVEKATLPEQRVVEGTLLTLPDKAKAQPIEPPALLIVGEVVRLRAKLGWFGPAKAESGTDHVISR